MKHPCSECKKEFELTKRQEGHVARGNNVICPKNKCRRSAERKIGARSRAKRKPPPQYYKCPFCGNEFEMMGVQVSHLNRGDEICCRSKKCINKMRAIWRKNNITPAGGKRGRPKKNSSYKSNNGTVSKSQKARIQASNDCHKYEKCLYNDKLNCHKCDEPRTKGAWMMSAEIPRRMADETHEINFRENLR